MESFISLIMELILPVLAILGLPFIILRYEKKFKLIEWLSPVVCCYGFGILLGNLPAIGWPGDLSRNVSEVSVMVATPLLLLSTDFPGWLKLAKTTILSFVFLVISVMVVGYLSGLLFQGRDPEVWKMAGMLTGVYIGSTPNLTAIGKVLEVREEAFIILNAVDIALGGAYLLFILSIGVKIISLFLRPFPYAGEKVDEIEILNWRKLTFLKKARNAFFLVTGALITIGISLYVSRLFTGTDSPGIIILFLTFVALGLSFNPRVRNFEGSQEVGQYFLLVFCIAVGSLANVDKIVNGDLWYFQFCVLVMFGSILLHLLICYLMKIDRDTAIITSMAGIFGPAFVPPMCQVLKNKAVLVSGITTGLVGYALGNFAGLIVAWLLKT